MDQIRTKVGENALKIGGTGLQVAGTGGKLQAQTDTASRPDFVGPPPPPTPTPTPAPLPKAEPTAPAPTPDQSPTEQKPMRTAPGDVTPVEPTLPSQ